VQWAAIAGPGTAGKLTLAVSSGEVTGPPVVELDKLFWRAGLAATPRRQVGSHPARTRQA
jgi:hypothetical protein